MRLDYASSNSLTRYLSVQPMTRPTRAQQCAIALVARVRLLPPAAAPLALAVLIAAAAGCTAPPAATPTTLPTRQLAPTATPAPPVVVEVPSPVPAAAIAPTPAPATPERIAPPKEAPLVELPDYAKRGKRLPAHGSAPGRAVLSYCRSFEIEKDAASYFKTLQRNKRLPSADEVAERSRQAGQALTVQQVVERDWALRRDSNKSAPQRCKVLGGSVDGAMAHVVFEADLNGRRQRGAATLLQADKAWRVRDHGDWAQVK